MCGYCTGTGSHATPQHDRQDHPTKEQDIGSAKEGKFAQYLLNLSAQLRALKEQECSSLIVYGAAFGEQYTNWLTRQKADGSPETQRRYKNKKIPFKMNTEQVQQLLRIHGPCFITFVLSEHINSNVSKAFYDMNSNNSSTNANKNTPKYYYSNDGLQLLIPIDRNDLPYKNMRRNTKIFKIMGASYLFGDWVERVIWQDTKLIAYNVQDMILPHNYYEYFFNAIHMTSLPRNSNPDENNVCASFMGLPNHIFSMGQHVTNQESAQTQKPNSKDHSPVQSTVHFMHHCDTIIEASQERPTVSDDLDSVKYQCSTYFNQTSSRHQQQGQNSPQQSQSNTTVDTTNSLPWPQQDHSVLDDALIDSAIIVWDLRSERCQNFIATLTCTWLDEIHCYSDRDQISFPHVFHKMGLHAIPLDMRVNHHHHQQQQKQQESFVTPETHHRLFSYLDSPLQPMVHISKSSCHWYYNSLSKCDFTKNDSPSTSLPLSKSPTKAELSSISKVYKVAVVVTGSFNRFIFQSSIQRLIKPLSDQGHLVDYYLSLSMKKAPAYRSDQTYMNYQVSDPIFDKYVFQDENRTLLDAATMKEQMQTFLQQELKSAGANLRYSTFQDNYDGVDMNAKVIERRSLAAQLYPNEDPDLRFPLLDIRNAAIMHRTANANRNMLNLFYHIQHVYEQLLTYEMDVRVKYDYVMFLRDDTMWFNDFDLQAMIDDATTTTTRNGRHSVEASSHIELFVPSCDARVPSMHPMEINDHIAIVKRNRADIFGKYFDELFMTDMDKCAKRLDDSVRYDRNIPGNKNRTFKDDEEPVLRGCNSEMILRFILERKNVKVRQVGQGKVPFQRTMLVKNPVSLMVQSCFHKYCQSHIDPMIIPSEMKKCTEMKFGTTK
jgi:hypothetical protein